MTAYVAVFRYFRDQLLIPVLDENLPDPILTFSRGRKHALASFEPDVWKPDLSDAERRCELSITPEHTADDPRQVMSSLVHEMCHYADHLAGTAPKSSGYHGKKWAERMARLGLPEVRRSKKSRISVSHTIEPDGAYAKAYERMPKSILLPFVSALQGAIETGDDAPEDGEEKKPTKQGKRYTYECGKCETTMRGPSGRSLICGDCKEPYKEKTAA